MKVMSYFRFNKVETLEVFVLKWPFIEQHEMCSRLILKANILLETVVIIQVESAQPYQLIFWAGFFRGKKLKN